MDDELIGTGGAGGKKCTSCTKMRSFVHISALVETSIFTKHAYIGVDKFVVEVGPFRMCAEEKDERINATAKIAVISFFIRFTPYFIF